MAHDGPRVTVNLSPEEIAAVYRLPGNGLSDKIRRVLKEHIQEALDRLAVFADESTEGKENV